MSLKYLCRGGLAPCRPAGARAPGIRSGMPSIGPASDFRYRWRQDPARAAGRPPCDGQICAGFSFIITRHGKYSAFTAIGTDRASPIEAGNHSIRTRQAAGESRPCRRRSRPVAGTRPSAEAAVCANRRRQDRSRPAPGPVDSAQSASRADRHHCRARTRARRHLCADLRNRRLSDANRAGLPAMSDASVPVAGGTITSAAAAE